MNARGPSHALGRCRELAVEISDYLDGALTVERLVALEGHLAECTCCAGFAETLRQSVSECRASGKRRLPADVRRRARARIAEIMQAADPGTRRTRR